MSGTPDPIDAEFAAATERLIDDIAAALDGHALDIDDTDTVVDALAAGLRPNPDDPVQRVLADLRDDAREGT